MNLSTLLCRASLACAAIMVGLTSQAAEVTLNGFTTVGESKALKVTYALNKTEKVARVRRVNDTSDLDKKRKSCVIPQTITVDKVKYTVKYIGKGAFSHIVDGEYPSGDDPNQCFFQRVELPNTITEIGEYAFDRMGKLQYCNIPASIQKIYPYAFRFTKIEKAHIPASCTAIGAGAFYGAEIKDLTFAEGTSPLEIGAWAFQSNPITTLVTPQRLKGLWQEAFHFCGMTDLVLNGSLTVIPDGCFLSCDNLQRVTINAPIVTIEGAAFQNLPKLQSFKINTKNLKEIQGFAFTRSGLTSIGPDVLPEGLISIGGGCFEGSSKLTTVIFPTTIKKIEWHAFTECPNIRRIDCYIPWGVPDLDRQAFDQVVYNTCDVNVKPELAHIFAKSGGWYQFNWSKYGDLAVDDIPIDNLDASQPVEYYNLQGMRVDADALTPGIYIRRHGGKSEKIAIR